VKSENQDGEEDDGGDRAESPEKGEDFDFDEVFDNDDDAMVPEDEEVLPHLSRQGCVVAGKTRPP
jgi:hypothetical protein